LKRAFNNENLEKGFVKTPDISEIKEIKTVDEDIKRVVYVP